MGGEQTIRDLQTAEWLAEEHRRLRAELEGREQERSLLVNIGRDIERAGHCPAEVVHQRLSGLDQAFAAVRKEWALKADWLEQAVQWHAFQREALQILAQIQARDRSLDALEQQREFDNKNLKEDKQEKSPAHRKRELNTLICVLATLEERISRLGDMAETLEEQGHAETEQIQALTRRVTNALNELGEHTNYVKRSLDAAEELAQFEAELADLTDWLIEKEESFRAQQVASFNSSNDSGQLTNKLERLKRRQALQSELTANAPRLERLLAHKEKIYVRQRGADVKQAIIHCEEFFQRWNQLLAQSKALDAALEEARDLLELEQLADRFGAYLRDKEALVQAEELGGDLEHCQTLINRLKEAHKGVDEKTLIDANTLAKKRMFNSKGGNAEASHIIDRLNDINKGWEHLSGRIHNYQALLEAALEVHCFNRDVDETNQRIGEKTSLLSAEQQAKDLAGVERLLRAQDQAERDMSAIHRKLNEHDEQAKLLLAQDPPLRETVLDSLRKLELSWQRLAELAHARRQALQQTYSLHHFLDLVRRTDQWAQSIRAKMSGHAPSRNVAEAERALQRHAERLAEIGARDEEFRSLREFCQRLLQEQPEHRSDLQRAQRRLQTLEHQTRQYWEREQQTLERSLLFQKILAQIGQIDCWLAGKQAQLDGLTAGESPESADAAIRELGHFIVALESQLAERFSWIDSTNKTLDSIANDHPEVSRVKERVEEIKEKCNELQKQTETKQRNLNANKHLAQFLRECAELITWMNAKLQLAMDDGYLDATALRLKLKKHLAFDAELRASEERIGRLQKRGQCLLNEEFGKDCNIGDKEESEERVRAQLEELNNGWTELLEKSAEKTDRLRSAYEAYQLGRRISESECWLERVEAIISSEDHGIDCSSAEQLLEQFENLRTEIRAKGLLIEELFQEAYKLMEKSGEDLGTNRQILYERAEALRGRWNAVDEPCQIRSQNLSEAVSFYHWADQTDEQIEWLESRVRLLESSDYGRSLHSAQSLLQKHQILEKEFSVRQPTFGQLITTGEKMLLVEMKNNNLNEENKKEKKQKGLKSGELTERLDKLHDLITLFRALASVREQRLNESLLSQEFYAEAAEAEHWMKERLIPPTNIQLTSYQQESGRQAEAQLRRCLALEKEIITFEDQLKKLGEKCERMVSADHFDLTGLQTRYGQLLELFSQLSLQCQQRKTQTTNAIRYFGFVRRADELLQWLRERLSLAEREDYGQDLEECELLAQQFHEVVRELASAGERVAQVLTLKEELLREKHPNAGSIRAKGQDVQQLWHEVNEAANERQQALIDGKNIHLFDQKADELLERLAEKEAYLLAQSEEQFGGIDLDQMFGQRERHNNEFMHSLDVLSRQVLELCAEADRIIEIFPRTSEHLEVRRGELIEQLKDVREGADRQAERQAQSQANHQYFQEFRELMVWARQMHASITGELLPKEVAGCEALTARHAEFRREISSKESEKLHFIQKGEQLLSQGQNALVNEIRSRITTLEEVFSDLLRTWHRRQQIYEDNADLQRWLFSASELERWLTEREQLLAKDWTGLVQDGLEAVENQIRQFDDFLATLDAQSPQFEALKRLTRLEQNWERLKGQEDRERIVAVNAQLQQQQQQNRRETQPIRTLEKKKMLQEKRQERERRKTQEISLMGNSNGGIGRQSITGQSIRSSTSAHSGAQMLGQLQQLEPIQSLATTAFNSSQTLPRARQRAAVGATSSASSSTSVVVVEGQQNIVPPVASSRLSIEILQPSSTQQQQNLTPSVPFPVGMRVPSTGRTPGFTTRRTQSIRRSRQWDDLRTVDIHGYLDRKQELQAGGKRATFRSWKSYYSILCGQLLCFFKDEQHFMENMAAAAPLALHGSNSALNPEYIKKRFVFKLNTADGAEFLFAAPDQLKALEWVDKINFRAKLDPADQLLAFRPSTSEPLGNSQSKRLPYSSTAADVMSSSRSMTLESRPKPKEFSAANTFKVPNEKQKMIKSATLDPRKINDDNKHTNYYYSSNNKQKNEENGQNIVEQQQFASQIKIGDEVDEEEKIIVEEEDLENSPNNNCRNNQNGTSNIFEDNISVRSGIGGTFKNKKITSGAFAFLRRSSAVIGGKKSACENSLD